MEGRRGRLQCAGKTWCAVTPLLSGGAETDGENVKCAGGREDGGEGGRHGRKFRAERERNNKKGRSIRRKRQETKSTSPPRSPLAFFK